MVFVNGCFWHGHEGCRDFVWPKSNPEFWKEKIEANIRRDNEKAEVKKLLLFYALTYDASHTVYRKSSYNIINDISQMRCALC